LCEETQNKFQIVAQQKTYVAQVYQGFQRTLVKNNATLM